jgi:alpha-beta hydrolase superfamily lysophospholipase
MSADHQVEVQLTDDLTESIYFGSEHQVFGWLHLPAVTKSTDIGLLICNPFGYEAICSHRSVRAFAEAAAAIGVVSLRFDYRGTGDSADIDPDADQIYAWSLDVAAAVSELCRRTGVRRVCLLGFRMGALLATLAARQLPEVCGLMAIAPIVSGRRYLRELRTTRLAAMLGSQESPALGAEKDGRAASGLSALEVSGFSLSAATLATLGKIDLCALEHAPPSHVVVIDAESLPVARAWADVLSKAGAAVRYEALTGTVEMLMTAPQFAVVPRHMVVLMQEWLSSVASAPGDRMIPRDGVQQLRGQNSVMTLRCADGPSSLTLTERALRFGLDCALFGIVTEPPLGERRRRAVILLNPGVDHHIGASRLYVSLARKWAGRGYVVLRMDLAGIGDSATRPGNQDDEVFPGSALDDIRAAIDYLARNYKVRDISLAGLCSGAYHALRAAASGIQVHRILMINPQNYFWKQGMSLNDLQLAEVVRNPGVYRQQVLSAAAWKRLIGGEVNLLRIVKIYVQRVYLAVLHGSRDVARRLHIRLPNDLGRELEEIGARGISIVFVFARGEPGLDLLKLEGGSSIGRLGNRCRVYILDRGDHVFSHHDSRAGLEKVLAEELFKKALLQDT